jgi:hypothetical protein
MTILAALVALVALVDPAGRPVFSELVAAPAPVVLAVLEVRAASDLANQTQKEPPAVPVA